MDFQEVVNLNEICRVCLTKTENMKQLLNPCDEVIDIISKLSSILNSEIEMSNSLPSFLCCNCEEKLKLSYEFNLLCHKSHQFILACMNASNKVPTPTKSSDIVQCKENPMSHLCSVKEPENSKDIEIVVSQGVNQKMFTEVGKKTKSKQVMRLDQYSSDDVNRAVDELTRKHFQKRDCLYCTFSANDSRALSVHMTRLHSKYRNTWCSKCNETVQNLEDHVQKVHKDEFKCPFCGKETNNTGHFVEHLACHTVERKFVCMVCDKCFISARHLRAHARVHNTSQKLYCQSCLMSFSNKELLNKHLKSHKKQICEVCEEIFEKSDYELHKCYIQNSAMDITNQRRLKTENTCVKCNKKVRNLNAHINNFHKDTSSATKALCTFCGKQFKVSSKLSVHLRTHTGEAPYKCKYCDAKMSTRSHLVVHERIHTGEKPHVCKVCGKGFAQSSVLNTHMRIHTGRTEHCSLCPKKFCRPSELRQHMRKHTGEKPYLCNHCEKSFAQKSHLVEHLWTHSEERPFKCQYCDKGFKQASTLKSHLNIHLGKKPFKCPQCPYACRQSYSLNQHMLQHENDQSQADKSHRCVLCTESFASLDTLTSHCSRDHASSEVRIDFIGVNEGEEQSEILQQLLEQ